MRSNAIRRNVVRAAVLAAAVGVSGGSLATSGAAGASPVAPSQSGSIVPPAGSGTALGYTALIRHQTSDRDNQGKLVLVAPDGAHKTIGEVSDGAGVYDVSSNARTVVTGFLVNQGAELRLSIWDTETGKAKYLRVKGGRDVALTASGLVVARDGAAPQLFSRDGQLLRTYPGTGGREVMASPDGTKVVTSDSEDRVQVRDAKSGSVLNTVPVPAGEVGCSPGLGGETEFTMSCWGSPYVGTAYSVGYTGDESVAKLASPAGSARYVADGVVHYYADGDTNLDPQPTWTKRDGSSARLKVGDASNEIYVIAGAYQDSVFLAAENVEYAPSGKLVRKSLSTGKDVVLAGPGSKVGGLVTSAVTVDGS